MNNLKASYLLSAFVLLEFSSSTTALAQVQERNECEDAAYSFCVYNWEGNYTSLEVCYADQLPQCRDGGGGSGGGGWVALPGPYSCHYTGSYPRIGNIGC